MSLKYEPASEPLHISLKKLFSKPQALNKRCRTLAPGACWRRFRLATQDCYSRKATMGSELMAPRTDHTTRIPSGVASPISTSHEANGRMFANLRNGDNLKLGPQNRRCRTLAPGACWRRFLTGAPISLRSRSDFSAIRLGALLLALLDRIF